MIDLAADSATFVGDFGESLRLRLNSDATPRDVVANVNRNPVMGDGEQPFDGHRPPTIHIMLRNHATLGVTPDEVVADTSEIEVDFPLGAAVRWRRILRVIRHNAGAVLLEVGS